MANRLTVAEIDARAIADTFALWNGTRTESVRQGDRACRIISERDTLFSYGRHFPLVRHIPREGRRAPVYVINGDTWPGGGWSSRTGTHQAVIRRAVESTGCAHLIAPFSALEGAGIDVGSIRPIHVRADAEWNEYDPVGLDLDALETASRFHDFGNREGQWREACGRKYVWRREGSPDVTRTFYTFASVYSGERGYSEWREAAPGEYLPGSHAYLGGSRDVIKREGEWQAVTRMHRLGDSLFSAVRNGKRARFLSSFDTNENPPLYFLAAVPRGSGDTVEAALDALAPRAVHAAMARGVDVQRQGDIFFIATSQSRESLEQRGATFARLTLWSRDATPKRGEVGYRAPQSKAAAAREAKYRRRIFREVFRGALERAAAGTDRADARELNRERWRELIERHATERAECDAAGVAYDAAESVACPYCTAAVGEPCRPLTADDFPAAVPYGMISREESARAEEGSHSPRRRDGTLATNQSRDRYALQRETASRHSDGRPVPSSRAGSRARWRKLRADHAARIEAAHRELRACALGAGKQHYARGHVPYGYSARTFAYRERARAAVVARENLERLESAALDNSGHRSRAQCRDDYRARFGANAIGAHNRASDAAAEKYRPGSTGTGAEWQARRDRARRACAIYGTAHSATEIAMVAGSTYVRGTARHVPTLEPGRNGRPDHRAIKLGTGAEWYLALRNRVPRQ